MDTALYELDQGVLFTSNAPIYIFNYIFLEHPPLYVTFSVRLPAHRAPYFRDRTSSDYDFWYTYVKW